MGEETVAAGKGHLPSHKNVQLLWRKHHKVEKLNVYTS